MSIIHDDPKVGPLRCGNCRGKVWELTQGSIEILVTCQACGSTSFLKPQTPKLKWEWGDDHQKDLGLPYVSLEQDEHADS
jgi:DNA-directed RNA polymerase subunit RPC12/RpoP